MKRFGLMLMLLCMAGAVSGRTKTKEERFREKIPYKYEIRIGYGGTPMYDTDNFMYSWGCYEPVPCYDNPTSLNYLYRTRSGDSYVTGVFTAEFSIHYRRWFTLAFNIGINGMWGTEYNPAGKAVSMKRGASFNIMPIARFHYINTRNFRMYSGAGVGLYAGFYDGETVITPAGILVPAGFSVGQKVFFFGETVLSTASFGGNIGIGYRF